MHDTDAYRYRFDGVWQEKDQTPPKEKPPASSLYSGGPRFRVHKRITHIQTEFIKLKDKNLAER